MVLLFPPSAPARAYSTRSVPPFDPTRVGHGLGIPMSSSRHSAVDLSAIPTQSFANDCLGSLPYHRFAPDDPLSPPGVLAGLSADIRPRTSRARHLSRDARMTFRISTGTLTNFRYRSTRLSARPNSLRSLIHRTFASSFDHTYAPFVYLHSYCCFDRLLGHRHTTLYTIHTAHMNRLNDSTPSPSDCR